MTPFDPAALLVMLLAFYPVVSVPQLQRARSERPEYFAAGTLGGSKGEKLFLQDGRVFDLIAAAGGPPSGRRWQAIDVTNDVGGEPDPFALEEGPLTPLDDADTLPAPSGETFAALVAGHLAALDGADDVLVSGAAAIAESDGTAALEASTATLLDPATQQHANTRAALDHDDPADELESAGLTRDEIDARLSEYDEPLPETAPEDDPGGPPSNDPDTQPGHGKD